MTMRHRPDQLVPWAVTAMETGCESLAMNHQINAVGQSIPIQSDNLQSRYCPANLVSGRM